MASRTASAVQATRIGSLTFLIAAVFVFTACSQAEPAESPTPTTLPPTADEADPIIPVFSVSSIDGETVDLDNLLGTAPVYLLFIPTTSSEHDRNQLRAIESNFENFRELGAEVVVVVSDWPPPVLDMRDELGLSYPLIADPLQVIAADWGVLDSENLDRTNPASFIFDAFGNLIARLIAADPTKRPDVEEVLNAIEESLRSGTA